MPRPTKDIVAIGGSTGSGAVLKRIVADLPVDLPASIFVSTHMPAHGASFLTDILSSSARLPVSQAIDGQPIERGHIYVAAPDRHLLLIGETIRLGPGPRENMARPAIDPLFRSAALSFGSRAIGVVLTGMLNDGASGLAAIKARGGTSVVQHPLDAEADQMPLAALEATEVDYVASAADLARALVMCLPARMRRYLTQRNIVLGCPRDASEQPLRIYRRATRRRTKRYWPEDGQKSR